MSQLHAYSERCIVKNDLARWPLTAFVILLVAACQPAEEPMEEPIEGSAEESVATDTSAHEAAMETFFAVWNKEQGYDQIDSIMAPGFRRQGPDQDAEGRAEMKEFMRQVHSAYPDFHIELNESAHEGNIAFTYWTVTGTHSGEGAVPATGKSVGITGMTLLRFEEGMITEELAHYDTATLQEQLGVEAVPHAE